jgi:hypothetical protein
VRGETLVDLADVDVKTGTGVGPAVGILCPHQGAQCLGTDARTTTDKINNALLNGGKRWQSVGTDGLSTRGTGGQL